MKDNVMNKFSRKVKRGSELPQSKLTEDDIVLIKALDAERIYHKEKASNLKRANVAEKFNVHVRTIEKVLSGETWAMVGDL